MSTRCQIGFYRSHDQPLDPPDAMFYRHSDGYPDSKHGVVEQLLPFLKRFHADRGLSDAEYAAARSLAHLIRLTASDGLLGYGIDGSGGLHGDIEHFYRVDPSGLTVFTVPLSSGKQEFLCMEQKEFHPV